MTTIIKNRPLKDPLSGEIRELVTKSWEIIAPFWPLENLIGVNPLQGLEDLPFEEALLKSGAHFSNLNQPTQIEEINKETIKWLQPFFDEGQATIKMPSKRLGLYLAWKQLAIHDPSLHKNETKKIEWLKSLPESSIEALTLTLSLLGIPEEGTGLFLERLLTTLPGWASYIKYLTEWGIPECKQTHSTTQIDYLAMRSIIAYLLWPGAIDLLDLENLEAGKSPIEEIETLEKKYRYPLLNELRNQKIQNEPAPSAQLVFCIDVRSEQFRRSLESVGNYETFGYAGFFGIPAQITNSITEKSCPSCPVLLSPKHEITEFPSDKSKDHHYHRANYQRGVTIKKLYQSIKYTFTSPFGLVEAFGATTGLWLGLRTLAPSLASKLKQRFTHLIKNDIDLKPSIENIPLDDQCAYAEGALRMIGLTELFAPIIVFCGHGSSTENNPYASSLDCGACGGRHGTSNARILAAIMNRPEVRHHLKLQGFMIPETTLFIGGHHNTTTDEITLHDTDLSPPLIKLKEDLEKAQIVTSAARLKKMGKSLDTPHSKADVSNRSKDWAQVRPEWGLAKNAAFIVAPRSLTKSLDLEARCFLHSYDYSTDREGKSLETILTAPMIVGQWINSQYLFSTLDNVSFGGGSKVTANITGKIGMMQGNASDLMTGLPLQSVYSSDCKRYHEPQRLMTVVYAPRAKLGPIIEKHSILQKLFKNGWVQLVCIEPESRDISFLQRDLEWVKMD